MTKLTANQAKLFLDPNFAVVATVKGDGSPQTSVVWVDYDGENVVFNTMRPRAKGRHLTRDPRVSVSVIDRENPYRYVEVEGEGRARRRGRERAHQQALPQVQRAGLPGSARARDRPRSPGARALDGRRIDGAARHRL